jgi:dienelactone hydrolase
MGGRGGTGGGANGGLGGAGGSGTAGSTGAGGRGGSGGSGSGTCTASKSVNTNATGSGPHKVTVEINAGAGISEGTIFRPTDLGGAEKYPIFVWGEGACSKDGLSNATAMAEIASHGYFVVADGTPNGTGNRTQDRSMLKAMAAPLVAYVDWAIAENGKSCSAYYQSLDTTKIGANGFSCGGLMSQAMVVDSRVTTWGVNSSGMAGANQDYYDMVRVPVLFVEGGPSDIAYDGGGEGYAAISKLKVPVLWFSKELGHGGDLFAARGGDFTKINIAWLNWWLKNDQTATGKGLLVGAGCPYCSNAAWEYKSMNIP